MEHVHLRTREFIGSLFDRYIMRPKAAPKLLCIIVAERNNSRTIIRARTRARGDFLRVHST